MKKKILLTVTIIITLAIFIHSSMNAVDSSEESGALLQFINSIASSLHIQNILNEHSIRKLAHFTEFSILGIFLSWTVFEYCKQLKTKIFMILFFLLAVPVTDETIQYFPIGRSAEVKDVLLDFSGAVTGFLIASAIIFIIQKKRKNT